MQEQIERYIKGELSENEIDDLWIKFIADPELFDHFNTYLHLIAICRDQKAVN